MRLIAAVALLSLVSAPALAQPPADRLGRVEPAPILVSAEAMRLRNDLAILQAALEGYRAAHFFRYPEAGTIEALIDALVRSDDLPDGFRIQGTVTEFVADRRGYRISARTDGDALTIRTPQRFEPLWSMLLH